MRVLATAIALVMSIVLAPSSAADPTATVGGATATAIGSWVKPTGCSQFPVEYAGLPAGGHASIHVLDAVTRSNLGSAIVLGSDPRKARVNVQVCSFNVEDTTSLLLSLDVGGLGVADSPSFSFVARPGTVRCVNKATYEIKEFTGKKCPKGWVRR
ncbi:MAG: hypothetical protein Q8M17_06535 [Actinomycetota bacterium]|nr:hypothetical protein [Actinomycetota bacterium]